MNKPRTPLRGEPACGFDLADVSPRQSGLPFVVFMMERMGTRCGMRIKVAPTSQVYRWKMVTVAIRPTVQVINGELDQRELALLTRWIHRNRRLLVRYWNGEMSTIEAFDAVKPISVTRK